MRTQMMVNVTDPQKCAGQWNSQTQQIYKKKHNFISGQRNRREKEQVRGDVATRSSQEGRRRQGEAVTHQRSQT